VSTNFLYFFSFSLPLQTLKTEDELVASDDLSFSALLPMKTNSEAGGKSRFAAAISSLRRNQLFRVRIVNRDRLFVCVCVCVKIPFGA